MAARRTPEYAKTFNNLLMTVSDINDPEPGISTVAVANAIMFRNFDRRQLMEDDRLKDFWGPERDRNPSAVALALTDFRKHFDPLKDVDVEAREDELEGLIRVTRNIVNDINVKAGPAGERRDFQFGDIDINPDNSILAGEDGPPREDGPPEMAVHAGYVPRPVRDTNIMTLPPNLTQPQFSAEANFKQKLLQNKLTGLAGAKNIDPVALSAVDNINRSFENNKLNATLRNGRFNYNRQINAANMNRRIYQKNKVGVDKQPKKISPPFRGYPTDGQAWTIPASM